MNRPWGPALMLLAGLVSASVGAADAPSASEFAWRATLAVPAGASMARVSLPADAMLRLQSRDARDLRVFNAKGEAVAFALAAPAGARPGPAPQTRPYTAYPLFTAASGQRPAKGSVQVRIDQGAGQGSVWVRLADAGARVDATDAATTRLPSVLFDTREEKQTINALTLQAELPPNVLLHLSLASSPDLAHWTPVALQGPLFRFEGAGAPVNYTLELAQALRLEGRYLRLSWDAQAGVQVNGFTGRVTQDWVPPTRVRAPLPAGIPDGPSAINWPLDFAAPLAALHLSATQDNTLVPVRILARDDAAQPWRALANGLVYRLGTPGQETRNPAFALGGASVHWLRVEASHGMTLPNPPWQASVEFEPIQLIFLASGPAPFELAVGRARSAAAAVDSSVLTALLKGKPEDLPSATITAVQLTPTPPTNALVQRWLPAGIEQRSVILWLVLVGGVGVLAGVAYLLLRQLSAPPAAR
jgi:hypothetical protein